jgi:hypothetical protein
MTVAFSLPLHNSPLYSIIHIHAALGGGGPRHISHCCCHVLITRCQLILAGSNGDSGRQLPPDGGSIGPLAVEPAGGGAMCKAVAVFIRRPILNSVIFGFASFS